MAAANNGKGAPLPACGVILAGGQSTRMGRNKALIQLDGIPLIQHVARRLVHWFEQVVVVTNTPNAFDFLALPMVGDAVPGLGPLAGIQAGLRASVHPAAFFAGCDMPLLDQAAIHHLFGLLPGYDAVVPVWRGKWEPTHAFYTTACLPVIDQCLGRDQRKLTGFFAGVRVRRVEAAELMPFAPPERIFFNCNTPDDLALLTRLWAEPPGP